MKKIPALALFAFFAAALRAQIIDSEPGVVAGIPANYTEAKTGGYTLPDPLKFADGAPVTDAKAWFEKRRPELFKLIEETQYGRVPPRPAGSSPKTFLSAGAARSPAMRLVHWLVTLISILFSPGWSAEETSRR